MMRSSTALCALLVACLASMSSASVFLPKQMQVQNAPRSFSAAKFNGVRSQRQATAGNMAMAIPGYGVAEQVFVGGFQNFLSAYNIVITGRILLSWFPQAAEIGALQPVYAITDPYLNLFRGIIPPVFGLDISPLAAFFLLSVMTKATVAVGAEIPCDKKQMYLNKSVFGARPTSKNPLARFNNNKSDNKQPSLNY